MYFHTTALTVRNISKVLEGVEWERLCRILDISDSKREELEVSLPSDDQRREGTIKWWITTDPLASWRRIVDQLYRWWGFTNEELALGDMLRHCCEELTGMCIHHTMIMVIRRVCRVM